MLYVDMEVNGIPLKVEMIRKRVSCAHMPLYHFFSLYTWVVDFYMILYLWELHLRTESQECLMFMYMVLFQAFVDSGAQSTIISKSCAERCGYVFFFFFGCVHVCVFVAMLF